MKAKTSVCALLAAACLAAVPFGLSAEPAAKGEQSVQAPAPHQRGHRPGMLSKEQREKQRAIMKEHRVVMDTLQDKLMQRQMELDYLSANPNVKADDIKAIIADIVEIHKQSRAARQQLREKMRDAGLPLMHRHPGHGRPHPGAFGRTPDHPGFEHHGPEGYGSAPFYHENRPMPPKGFFPHTGPSGCPCQPPFSSAAPAFGPRPEPCEASGCPGVFARRAPHQDTPCGEAGCPGGQPGVQSGLLPEAQDMND